MAEASAEPPRARHGCLTHLGDNAAFPFEGWARDSAYPYDRAWLPILKRCGSVAEVFFLRPFLERPGIVIDELTVRAGPLSLTLQHDVKGYKTDALIEEGALRLAIEVDGMAFHHRSREQVAADYLRQRRIVARGYTVIRFTAPEVFGNARECWRQIDAILDAWRARGAA